MGIIYKKEDFMPNNNVFPDCPVKRVEEIIEKKWTVRILLLLLQETRGFNELQKNLEGISANILNQRLVFLQERGLILKRVYQTNPISTFYSLTKKGEEFQLVIDAMAVFGQTLKPPVQNLPIKPLLIEI